MIPVARDGIVSDLTALGVTPGALLLVHGSFKAVGAASAEDVIGALLDAVGPTGTLMLPALSYLQEPHEVHDARHTPSCVGYLSEYFRTRPGTRRSLHPTHSVCAVGPRTAEMLDGHARDDTPCGPHSPFRLNMDRGGAILMLGCGLGPSTTMHAVEEMADAPYHMGQARPYTITDADGRTFVKTYRAHGFGSTVQRYDRIADVLRAPALRRGTVGRAESVLLDAAALRDAAVARIREQPTYFVDREAQVG